MFLEKPIAQSLADVVHWAEGMLFEGTHLFDTVRFLTGDEASWVFARLDEGDGVLWAAVGESALATRSSLSCYALDPDCTMALTKRAFPGSVVAKSPMTIAVEELIRALKLASRRLPT